jgi:hypothetical protein
VFDSSVIEVDDILERTPTELEHNKALEACILLEERLDRLINSALRRRNEAIEQLEFYGEGLGRNWRQVSDKIIDAEANRGQQAKADQTAPHTNKREFHESDVERAELEVHTPCRVCGPHGSREWRKRGADRLMTSESKIAANRRNGRKSRGPRTAAGKSIASRNALRHGFAAATLVRASSKGLERVRSFQR